jgi:hypothetical protein
MSEKFHLFKKSNIVFKVLAGIILILSIFNIFRLVNNKEFEVMPLVSFVLQVIFFILLINRNNSYYIEFCEKELILNFLKYRKKRIEIENIEEIKIKMFNIELTVKDEDKIIIVNLDNSEDDVRSAIKNRFQLIADGLNIPS